MPGASAVGGPYTFGGDLICVDECLERAQGYRVSGTLSQFQSDAARALVAKGYTITSQLACIQYAYPVVAQGHLWLDCSLEATNSSFSTTVWARFFRTEQLSSASDMVYHLPYPPWAMAFSRHDGDYVAVSVAMNQ